jgi:hypothetical protein
MSPVAIRTAAAEVVVAAELDAAVLQVRLEPAAVRRLVYSSPAQEGCR